MIILKRNLKKNIIEEQVVFVADVQPSLYRIEYFSFKTSI